MGGWNGSGRYWKVNLNGHPYAAHRVIWLMHYGYFPENEIDHINRNPLDNKLENLREASRTCNARNTGIACINSSGVKGVYWNKRDSSWIARIKVRQKYYHLGYFDNFCEAVLTRLAAEQCLNWHKCDTDSSAYRWAIKHNVVGNTL